MIRDEPKVTEPASEPARESVTEAEPAVFMRSSPRVGGRAGHRADVSWTWSWPAEQPESSGGETASTLEATPTMPLGAGAGVWRTRSREPSWSAAEAGTGACGSRAGWRVGGLASRPNHRRGLPGSSPAAPQQASPERSYDSRPAPPLAEQMSLDPADERRSTSPDWLPTVRPEARAACSSLGGAVQRRRSP